MESIDQIYILILLGISFILIGLLSGAIAYLLLKKNSHSSEQTQEKEKSVLPKTIKHLCANHEDVPSVGSCAICEESFCEICLQEWDGINFCSEHLQTFGNNKWVGITNIKTNPNNPEAAVYVYKFKKKQWEQNLLPSYIVTHYKINFEGDHIESYVMLYVRSQDEENFKEQLNQLN